MNSRIFKSLNLKFLNLIFPYALACGQTFINPTLELINLSAFITPQAEAAFIIENGEWRIEN